MEHKDIKLNKLTIYSASTGKNYVKMLVPEEWTSTIDRYENWYGGYCYPFVFKITNTSPTKDSYISYYSPFRFVDDYLNHKECGTIDENDYLHNDFVLLEDYLDIRVRQTLKDKQDITFIKHIPFSNNDKRCQESYDYHLKKAEERGLYLAGEYYSRGISIYSYKDNDTLHYFMISAFIDAQDFYEWHVVEDLLSIDIEKIDELYPGNVYDKENDCYLYPTMHRIEWEVGQLLEMDCLEADYPYAYDKIFALIAKDAVVIHDDVWNEIRQILEDKKSNNEKKESVEVDPEEQAKIDAIWAEYRDWKRNNDYQLYQSIRYTQERTNDILNESYHRSSEIHDRMNRGWSDTFMGNSRFVDRYGREHLIHTDNNYAYKRGNTYVTSNSPLDRPYDFEELKKKKY